MKRLFILFMAILPFIVTSCKKAPVASFGYDLQYIDNHSSARCVISNYSSNADSYEWTLYNYEGTYSRTSRDFEPTFLIDETGSYTLVLRAENSKDYDILEKTFNVNLSNNGTGGGDNPNVPAPTASFNFNSSNGNYAPTTIYVNNTSSNATRYQWTLTKPDYTSSTSATRNPTFTCSQAGTYTLKLIAYNSNDVSSTTEQSFTLITPSTVKITYLTLQKIPMTDTDNSSWDTGLLGGADPDIYFKLLNSSNSVLYTSSTKDDISTSEFPVTWNNVNKTLDYGSNYYIRFYDEDGSLDPDDLMVSCIFNTTYLSPGSTSYTWQSTNGDTKFVVGLSWTTGKGDDELITDSENAK